MIFVIFLIPIALLFGAIYWHDSNNEAKIYNYLEEHKCENITRYRAQFKGICEDKVLLINDYFILDFDSNEEIQYKDIASIKKEQENIALIQKRPDQEFKIYFETATDLSDFISNVNKKINERVD